MDLRKQDADTKKIPEIVRTARFMETEDGWFFRTREGMLLGPYEDKFDAELSASLLVARLAQLEPGKDPAALIQAFEHDPANATLQNAERTKQIDLKAIRRRHQIRTAVPTFQKAWSAVSRIKILPKRHA